MGFGGNERRPEDIEELTRRKLLKGVNQDVKIAQSTEQVESKAEQKVAKSAQPSAKLPDYIASSFLSFMVFVMGITMRGNYNFYKMRKVSGELQDYYLSRALSLVYKCIKSTMIL